MLRGMLLVNKARGTYSEHVALKGQKPVVTPHHSNKVAV
jgi:hypothetical protein